MKTTDPHRVRQTNSRAITALISAVLMLAIWAYVTITTVAPGWVHVLLTAGVFLLIYGIVARDDIRPRSPKE